MTSAGVQAASPSGLPWRGLVWAVALSLLAHAWTFWGLKSSLVFSFKGKEGNVSLSARVIEPVPVSLQPIGEQAEPVPFQTPTSEQTPAKSAPTTAASQVNIDVQTTEPARQNIEVNRPESVMESTSIATNTIANISPDTTSTLGASAAPSIGQPAPPGLKLQFPANAQLQFDEISMSRGVSQSGAGLLSWKLDGTSYELALEATAFSRSEKSSGQLSPQGLAPERYSSSRAGRSEQATHFRREFGKIQFSNNKPDEVLMVGAQDRLSAFLQLAGIIGGDQARYRIVNRITMQVASLEDAQLWEFRLEGISDINLPAANMQVLKLTRNPRNEYDQLLEIWLSPELGYLPVRIRQSSTTGPDQDFTDLRLRKRP